MTHDRGRSKFITHGGETLSQVAWSRRLGGNDSVVCRRLKLGWAAARAVSEPLGVRVKQTQGTNYLRERLMVILDLWRARVTAADIGAAVGLPRASVCRIIHEARTKLGVQEVPYLPRVETARRAHASRQAERHAEAVRMGWTVARKAKAVLEAHRKPLGGLEAPPHHHPSDGA